MADIKTKRFFTVAELLGEVDPEADVEAEQLPSGPSLAVKTLRHRHLTHRLFTLNIIAA